MIKLDDHMFSMGLVQPPTRQTLLKMKMHLCTHVGFLIAMFLFSRNEHVQSDWLSRATSFGLAVSAGLPVTYPEILRARAILSFSA